VPALLAADDVWASHGGVRALQGVSLEVPEGSVAAVVGPNGAGKTTLLRVLAGLHRPERGRVRFGGRDVTESSVHRRAQMGLTLVPEGRGVFPRLTVAENLRLAAVRGAALERARSMFPILAQRPGQPAGTLSGGEQQMLALARCLAAGTRAVMVDEPSLGLAPRLVNQVFATVAALRDAGITVVVVEQHVARILEVADLVYVLRKGRCEFAGEPGELRHYRVLEGAYLGAAR
jgi:branched-chain amino acid transport system ATP-binding protein